MDRESGLHEALSSEEEEDLKRKMCGTLKPRRLTVEEVEQLKREGHI